MINTATQTEKPDKIYNGSTLPPETIEAINDFIHIDENTAFLEKIDKIIEYNIKSGVLVEFSLQDDLGFLFDIKRLIASLPKPKFSNPN